MMFLRGALGTRIWHNDHARACLIIDDPLLKRHYGWLDYRQLIESMERHRFTTCIAFIPWNYRRSQSEIAQLFSVHRSGLHLCIHGCDHTGGEFASADFESLSAKAVLAMQRMREHARRSDVAFDDVMVFPQGLFSVEALSALNAAGYLAAVNTDPVPVSSTVAFKLSDLLDVAVTKVDGFPLFGRHYPRDASDFAMDLFLGKPALLVEHHGYFQNGCELLETFVSELNRLDRIDWTSLGEICSRASMSRSTAEGDIEVRFYTRRFSLTNTSTQAQKYVLLPRVTVGKDLPRVTCNGSEWNCESVDGQVQIPLVLAGGQTAKIELHPLTLKTAIAPWRGTASHNLGVRVRRFLCEMRDNHVHTNRVLSALLSSARNVLRTSRLQTALPE
jgi:hypothetical protein